MLKCLLLWLYACIFILCVLLLIHENSPPVINVQPTRGTNQRRVLATSALPASDRRLILLLSHEKISWTGTLLSQHPQVLMFSADDLMMTPEASLQLAERVFRCSNDALSRVVDIVNEQLEDGTVPWCGSRVAKLRTSSSGVYCQPAPKAAFRDHCLAHSVAVQLNSELDVRLLCEQLQSVKWNTRVLHAQCEQDGVHNQFSEDFWDDVGCSGFSRFCLDASEPSSSSVMEFLNFCDLFNDVPLTSSLIHHYRNSS